MLSSEVFLTVISPLSTSTFSLKFKIRSAFKSTLVSLSAGLEELKDGFITSAVVKLRAVVELIPA